MATPTMTVVAMPPTGKNNRGKDLVQWSDGVWTALDHAVMEEMRRTRVAAKFLPHVHVEKKQTNVAADVVISPVQAALAAGKAPPTDVALFVDESQTERIQEYWVTFKMSVAQVEEEEHAEAAPSPPRVAAHQENAGADTHYQMAYSQRASTGVSLAMRTANILAQAEDLILFNGQNAVANSPLFNSKVVQALDLNLQKDLDLGLLNLQPDPTPNSTNSIIELPASQVIPVNPVPPIPGITQPRYAENTLDAIALGFSILQGLGHYENYALVLQTIPYADLHQALPSTLMEPVEPISHLVKAGVYGTATFPPFDGLQAGLPTKIVDPKTGNPTDLTAIKNSGGIQKTQSVLYTGVLVSLSGNTMDHVRGRMDNQLDVMVTCNQKDANEQYRFRVVERFCLRLKDPSAVILLLFMTPPST
jgi:hypothetical protein